jgi:pimeloyl-ACP methyl ester carboxylesterase
LLWGEYDGFVPPAYAEAFKRIMTGTPSVRMHEIAAAGHVLFAEQPQPARRQAVHFSLVSSSMKHCSESRPYCLDH